MFEESVRYVNHVHVRLTSILLMSRPVTKNVSLIFKRKSRFMFPLSLRKLSICYTFELPNLHLHIVIVCFAISCQSINNILPRGRFILLGGSKKFSFLMDQSTSSHFALITQSFSCSLCNQLNSFLGSKSCRYTLRKCDRIF